ncbi:NID1 protein, partial [Atractosteus spatula]|nr:NID1 protein [Atractosteus spatula]
MGCTIRCKGWLVGLALLWLSVCTGGVSRRELFQYGEGAGDQLLERGDDTSLEFALDKPLLFYDGKFSSVHINTNGFIATSQPTSEREYLDRFPPSFGMVAMFLADLDTSDGVGKVFVRQDASPNTLQLAAAHINRAFPYDEKFTPTHTLIVTWEDVAAYQEHSRGDGLDSKRNTFQAVLASGEKSTYAILLYPRDGLQFSSTRSKGTDTDRPARVAFSKGLQRYLIWSSRPGPYYEITTSSEESVRDLYELTNSGKRGVWVYEIGTTPYFTNVAPGEVEEIPTEVPLENPQGGYDDEVPETRVVPGLRHKEEQQVLEYPPYQPYPHQPAVENPDSSPYEGRLERPALSTPEDPAPVDTYAEPIPVQPVQFRPQYPQEIGQAQQPLYPIDNARVVVVDGDLEVDANVFTYNSETCANSRQKCSNFADCRDYPTGYCCHCRPGYYGNGKHCVAEGKPQRMNGKVNGRLFVGSSPSQVVLSNNDLHSYVVANDGRAYVAISTIPRSLGPSLLPLSSLGGVIGWAFALEAPGHENGFSVVGGEFTRQAEVTFLPGNEKVTIRQEFKGIDEHDHLVVSTDVEGRLPEIPEGASVQIEPYSEIYHYSSQMITSSSTRDYTVTLGDGSTYTRSYQWRQTIFFQSCPHDEASRATPATQQLSVDQIFVMYDADTQLIRYAMSNKIGSLHGGGEEENACFTGRHGCDTNAACRPGQGNQFTCECATGFRGDGHRCYDIDECSDNPLICGQNAVCNNQPGTFRCECVEGYQFASDGRTCIAPEEVAHIHSQMVAPLKLSRCEPGHTWSLLGKTKAAAEREVDMPVDHCQRGTHNCDAPERARCIYTGGSSFICSCLSGFVGDGRSCQGGEIMDSFLSCLLTDIDECQPGRCHPNADCYNTPGSYRCQCRLGFYGDGSQCTPDIAGLNHQRFRQPVLQLNNIYCDEGHGAKPCIANVLGLMQIFLSAYLKGWGFGYYSLPFLFVGRQAFCYDSYVGCWKCRSPQQSSVSSGNLRSWSNCSPKQTGKPQFFFRCSSVLGARRLNDSFPPVKPLSSPLMCFESGSCSCCCRCGRRLLLCQCERDKAVGKGNVAGEQRLGGRRSTPSPPLGPTPRPDVHPLPPGTHLLFAQSSRIEFVPLEGHSMKKGDAKALLHLPDKVVIGVAFDCVEKMVYWTDITGPSISKVSLHGGKPVPIISTDLESPEGVAIDHLGRNVYWTDSMRDRIEVAKLDGSQRRVLFDTDLVNPRAIVTDSAKGHLYWTDWNREAPKIETSYMDGTNRRVLVKDDLGLPNGLTYDPYSSLLCWADADLESPEGVAIDHLGRNVYWTDSMRDRIEVAKLDGSQRRVLFDTDLVNPRAIVTDSAKGHLYWTDWNREAPKIETSYMDGTNRRVLVKDDLGLPNGLTYDPYSSLLCWADAGTRKVECMNPTQTNRRKILEGIQYPFGITSYGKNLYYTDWRRDAVVAADRTLGRESEEFQPQKRSRLYGIATAYSQCPAGQNYCSVNNGGCTHLCLANPSGRSCLCPDNVVGVGCVESSFGY